MTPLLVLFWALYCIGMPMLTFYSIFVADEWMAPRWKRLSSAASIVFPLVIMWAWMALPYYWLRWTFQVWAD